MFMVDNYQDWIYLQKQTKHKALKVLNLPDLFFR